MSDQDRISPYNINTILSSHVMRTEKKKSIRGLLLADPIPNAPNKHHKIYMADSKENN